MSEILWIQKLANKALQICRLNKLAAGNHRQDMTGPVLENLKDQGYTQVTWNSNGSRHEPCRDLNRQVWDLEDFLNTTEYDAPLFSRSHPGDASCTLIVSGDGVPNVEVDSYGDVDHNIRVPFPVKAPVPAKPKVKTLAPKPQTKVVETPVPPKKKKIVYVPQEVHKQIKDPFEKQELVDEISEEDREDRMTDEEYLQWLKELEQEEAQKSIPANPTYTDEEIEEWNRGMNRENSKKVPNWITGLFKG